MSSTSVPQVTIQRRYDPNIPVLVRKRRRVSADEDHQSASAVDKEKLDTQKPFTWDTENQRRLWNETQRVIRRSINQANMDNIKVVLPGLLTQNLTWARGVFCRSMLESVMRTPELGAILAALVAVVNSLYPTVGNLLVTRIAARIVKEHRRQQWGSIRNLLPLLAQLTLQQVVDESLVLECVALFLTKPSDEGVQLGVDLMLQLHVYLSRNSPRALQIVLSRFRTLLTQICPQQKFSESTKGTTLSSRSHILIQDMFEKIALSRTSNQNSRFNWEDVDILPLELDLVEDDQQVTHQCSLNDESHDVEDSVNFFAAIPAETFLKRKTEHDERLQVLGLDNLTGDIPDIGEESPFDLHNDEEHPPNPSSTEPEEETKPHTSDVEPRTPISHVALPNNPIPAEITKTTTTSPPPPTDPVPPSTTPPPPPLLYDDLELRRRFALLLQGSASPEEAAHKLIRGFDPGTEPTLAQLLLESLFHQPTYSPFYGTLASRLVATGYAFRGCFERLFERHYSEAEELSSKTTRQLARLMSHLLASESLPWGVLQVVRLSEKECTADQRVLLKYLLEDLARTLGVGELKERLLYDSALQPLLRGMFPVDEIAEVRYAMLFFASLGLSPLNERLSQTYRILQREESRGEEGMLPAPLDPNEEMEGRK